MNDIKRLKEDAEFKLLMPTISKNELVHLEQELLKGQTARAIYVWNGFVLAEYNRYEICARHHIECNIRELSFFNRSEAICWVCNYYLSSNESISGVMKKYLVGKQLNVQKNVNETSCDKSPRYVYQTAFELGKEYNLAQNTVYKYGIFSRSIDSIVSKEPQLAGRILAGALKISHDNMIELSRLPSEYLKSLNQNLSQKQFEHIGYSEVRHELLWKKLPTPQPRPVPTSQNDILIKQLPKYDPDSEISGLTLTIPSWISSISRTSSNADFQNITHAAKDRLKVQLQDMKGTIETMLNALKEDCNG